MTMPIERDALEPTDPSFANALSDSEVRIWINSCNHEPARQALRQLLAYRIRGVSAPLATTGWEPVAWRVESSSHPDEYFCIEGEAEQWANSPRVFDAVITPLIPASALTAANADRDRLEKELADVKELNLLFSQVTPFIAMKERAEAAEADRDRLARELEEAREALKPFAAVGKELKHLDKPDSAPVWGYNDCAVTYGDFRAALASGEA